MSYLIYTDLKRHTKAWKDTFNHVMNDMTDDQIADQIETTYRQGFADWDIDWRCFMYLRAWTGKWVQGMEYITDHLRRRLTNDNWWTEAIKYRIMRLESDILGSKVDDPYEWAKHVFPPQYEGCEEDEEEEEDEPSDWQPPVDRVLPYPRHHLKRKHYDDIDE